MAKIKIGADELILWLRKNNKAIGKNNPDLGAKILILMNSFDAKKLPEIECRWERSIGADGVDKLDLPKTATQYEISSDKIGALYEALNNW
jgi:hypothetical protein